MELLTMVNNEPYFASRDIVIAGKQEEDMQLIKTTMEAIKKELDCDKPATLTESTISLAST